MDKLNIPDCPICKVGPVAHWINSEWVVECRNPDCPLIAWAINETPLSLDVVSTLDAAAEQWYEIVKAYRRREERRHETV